MKYHGLYLCQSRSMSPPSRGAWIEIILARQQHGIGIVAPLAGGVD